MLHQRCLQWSARAVQTWTEGAAAPVLRPARLVAARSLLPRWSAAMFPLPGRPQGLRRGSPALEGAARRTPV